MICARDRLARASKGALLRAGAFYSFCLFFSERKAFDSFQDLPPIKLYAPRNAQAFPVRLSDYSSFAMREVPKDAFATSYRATFGA